MSQCYETSPSFNSCYWVQETTRTITTLINNTSTTITQVGNQLTETGSSNSFSVPVWLGVLISVCVGSFVVVLFHRWREGNK